MEILKIENLKKGFDGLHVIKDVSLTVNEGEVVSVIGPSGGGKSTLLRCATLLERMDGGSLSYMGKFAAKDVNGVSEYVSKKELRELRHTFGLVFQNFNLFPHYTVLKNITDAPITVDGVPKKEAEEKAFELLEKLGLKEKADAYPYQLSGGQQQRVSIARALARNPKILFFDEPTSALDPMLTAEVLKVIRGLAEQKMTMVIVTHEMDFARELSDRIVFLQEGVIRAQGTPDEVFNSDNQYVKEFVGSFSS